MSSIPTNFWLVIIAAIYAVLHALYRRRIKGAIGEQTVAWRLSRLPQSKYKVINNLVLKIGDKTSQIDHVIISTLGLFVVETKNFNGWIFGFENSEFWTQVIFRRRERFYNPIRQNHGHIRALKLALNEFPNVNYIPIVAFAGKCTLKVETDSLIVYSHDLVRTIKRYSGTLSSDIDELAIFEKLSSLNVSKTFNRKTHIEGIKKRVRKRESLINRNVCPQCGGDLIKRSSANGKFRGCSNFPKCRFTVKFT